MPSGKRVLGRGLADLIPVGGGAAEAPIPGDEVSIASLHPNPGQPRTVFHEEALSELTESIRTNGILQPILVRPRPTGGYEIVAGERRYRAALRAGLTTVPVVVRELSDDDTLAIALIENLIREDIGALEAARAFRRLMDDFGWTQEELGRRVGKSRSAVANSLRLLELPDAIQQSLERGEITEGHARALLGERRQRGDVDFRTRQQETWQRAVAKRLSVREVERMMSPASTMNSIGGSSKVARVEASPEIAALEERLRQALGTRVRITGDGRRGQVEIQYYSAEELDGLLVHLEGSQDPSVRTRENSRIAGLLTGRHTA